MMSLKGTTCLTPCVQGNRGCAAAPSLCIAFQVAKHRVVRSIPWHRFAGTRVGKNYSPYPEASQKRGGNLELDRVPSAGRRSPVA